MVQTLEIYMMAVRNVAAAACLAILASGCVIREIREIHHAPAGDSARSACAGCEGSVPGSVLADSQPPAPMVEEAGQPPADGYAWVDGYWHWNGAEWIWIGGRWVPPMNDFYFVPPAYYASGSDCVYVPGYWQRGPHSPYPIRDRRVISGYHSRGKGGARPRPGRHTHRPGNGGKPTRPPASLGGKRDGDAIVVDRPAASRPEKVAPASPAARPTSPAWRSPGVSAAPPSAPRAPSAPPPAQARPPAPSSPPPRAAPPPSPARVAPPGPSRAAPPSSPPPRAAPPPPPPRAAPPPPPRAAPSPPPARSAPPPARSAPPPAKSAPPPAKAPPPSHGGGSKKK